MNTEIVTNLLESISNINNSYSETIRHSGENFNIFKIIKQTSDEMRIHSTFLAELLNPKGSHGQGTVFLKLFVDKLNIDIELDYDKTSVEVEKHIGPKTKDRGGRIDIFVSDNLRKSIIIENKIYATDQENQLLRYNTYGKEKCNPYKLIYLTLEGGDASDMSLGNTTFEYIRMSYRYDILRWLEECQEAIKSKGVLREGIGQYMNLIKYLTNQSINEKMETEIKNKLKESAESLEAAQIISNTINNVKSDILMSFWESLENEFKKHEKENLKINQERKEGYKGFKGLKERVKSLLSTSNGDSEGLRIIIKEKNNFRFYWAGDISNFMFISGFYIRKYEDDKTNTKKLAETEFLPKGYNDYENFDEKKDYLNECGFVESNKWYFAYKTYQDLNFGNFSPTVCSFIDKKNLQLYVEKIATDAIEGIMHLR